MVSAQWAAMAARSAAASLGEYWRRPIAVSIGQERAMITDVGDGGPPFVLDIPEDALNAVPVDGANRVIRRALWDALGFD